MTDPLTDDLVKAAAAELTTPECPWHDTCPGACESAQSHVRAVLDAVRPVIRAEVDRLRAENTTLAGRIDAVAALHRPTDLETVGAELHQHCASCWTSGWPCPTARALGLDHDGTLEQLWAAATMPPPARGHEGGHTDATA